jgi:hypothetical protein
MLVSVLPRQYGKNKRYFSEVVMMKLVLLLSIALTVVLVPTSYGLVIGNFEGSLDNWQKKDAVISQDTIGATVGTGSMKIAGPGSWHIDAMLDLKPSLLGVLGSTTQISADVTAFVADMPNVGWMNMEMIYNGQNDNQTGANNNIGWQSLGAKDINIWDGQTHTLVWDVPAALKTKLGGVDSNIWWMELMIITNNGGQNTQCYVDNIKMIPEPATMGLLGMGGLALLRRRK